MTEAKVIIIGAGAAGLAAANELAAAGFEPLVLEARNRIGGRIHTIREENFNAPIELGAEFIHGVPPETFALARQANLNITETAGHSWHVTADGKLAPAESDEPQTEDKIWEELEKQAKNSQMDISLRNFLNQFEAKEETSPKFQNARRSIERYVAGFHAAEIEKIGLKSLVLTEEASAAIEGERAFHVVAGYDRVTEYLFENAKAHGAKFLFDSPVKLIKWQKNSAEVSLKNGEKIFSARSSIITLPIGVLQAAPESSSGVRFEPEIDSKRAAIEKIAMGAARRVSLVFRRKWWTEILREIKPGKETLGFLFGRNAALPVWWANEPAKVPLLTAWAGGAKAFELSKYDSEFVVNLAIESLCEIFSVERSFVESELLSSHTYDWENDEFTKGSYSYVCVDGIEAPRKLAATLENTLFFAGEATNFDGHWGTVHGALATGKRAAQEFLANFNQ